MNALYGCFSREKYTSYSISGEMFSADLNDDDCIVYNICFMTDDDGVEHTLSLVATTGGVNLSRNPNYQEGSTTVNIFENGPPVTNKNVKWALVYDFGKDDWNVIEEYITNNPLIDWGDLNQTTQTFNFQVNKSGKDITVTGSWDLPNDPTASAVFNYNIDDNEFTKKFIGDNSIGFSFLSQTDGGFKNVELIQPNGSFYTELRIDPKESQSDFSDNRISSIIEAPSGTSLTSIPDTITTGENLARLEYDGVSFTGRCLVNTDTLTGKNYDFSAEIRPINLEE
jgi:hypothetical protein